MLSRIRAGFEKVLGREGESYGLLYGPRHPWFFFGEFWIIQAQASSSKKLYQLLEAAVPAPLMLLAFPDGRKPHMSEYHLGQISSLE